MGKIVKWARETVLVVALALTIVVLVAHGRRRRNRTQERRGGGVDDDDDDDGRVVRQGTGEDMRRVAAMLSGLEIDVSAFLWQAAAAYPSDPEPGRILQRWNGRLFETREHTAVTEDKTKIRVCVRDEHNALLEYDVAKFIILHELAHVANSSWGHDDEYWHTFKKLAQMAYALGFVKGEIEARKTYCGSEVGIDPSACVRAKSCASAL